MSRSSAFCASLSRCGTAGVAGAANKNERVRPEEAHGVEYRVDIMRTEVFYLRCTINPREQQG